MTFPGGTHDLWIRYWLAAGGIDPDKDISTIVVPPPQMVANMKVGNMDAFCVGEPWNEQLVNQGIGFTACTTGEIWSKHPEKALGMRAAWVDKNPNATKALLMAVMEAQQWCEKMENKRGDGRRSSAGASGSTCRSPTSSAALKGDINYGNGRVAKGTKQYMKFWSEHASYPFKSHDAWFVTEDIRWGKFEATTDIKALVDKVNREDLWREAAKALSVAAADIPAIDLARQGDLLRRQGVRSGRSAGLPEEPVDQARRSLNRGAAALGGPLSATENLDEHARAQVRATAMPAPRAAPADARHRAAADAAEGEPCQQARAEARRRGGARSFRRWSCSR